RAAGPCEPEHLPPFRRQSVKCGSWAAPRGTALLWKQFLAFAAATTSSLPIGRARMRRRGEDIRGEVTGTGSRGKPMGMGWIKDEALIPPMPCRRWSGGRQARPGGTPDVLQKWARKPSAFKRGMKGS